MRHIFSWQYEKLIMPAELLEIAFDFDRDVHKLWQLDLPIEDLPTGELIWHLDMPFFWQPDKPFSLNPRVVLADPERYSDWLQRIMEVDTIYPIDVIWWNGRWQIVDGLHRFCKLLLSGENMLKVRKLPVGRIAEIMPD